MEKKKEIIIEAESLAECRQIAGKKLGISESKIRLRVIKRGKKGLFFSSPYKVKATSREQPTESNSKFSKQHNKMLGQIDTVLEKVAELDVFKAENEDFTTILNDYENLSQERRQEIQDVAALLDGNVGEKFKQRISKDGSFSLVVSEDELTCHINLTPSEYMGVAVSLHDVLTRMRERGIIHGVDHVRIRELLNLLAEKKRPIKNALIAQATPPQKGRDGELKYYIVPGAKELTTRDDGTIDYRGAARIAVVHQGDILAKLTKPEPGIAGTNIFGVPIPAEIGKSVEIKAGHNIKFVEESGEFMAAIGGIMECEDNTLQVHPSYVVSGDVDMSIGNIVFAGEVYVGGNVKDGFKVRASGNITIHGGIEGCEVYSENGSIFIHKGIAGHNRCFVSAAKDVKASYIENACVYAGGNIEVNRSVLHSELVAGNSIVLLRGKGAIIGGITKAANLVHCKRLGSPSEPKTEIIVGINIKEHEEIRAKDERLVALKNADVSLQKLIKGLEYEKKRGKNLLRKEKEKLADLKMKLVILHDHIDKTEKEKGLFLQKITAENKGEVRVSTEAFSKVIIHLGSFVEYIRKHQSAEFFFIDQENQGIGRKPYKI